MKLTYVTVALFLLTTACQPGATTQETTASSVAGCYTFEQNNSRVVAHLEAAEDSVKGQLRYDFYEKDDNEGEFAGTMRGDTLLGVYTFYSEGQQSKREVAFLRQGDRLVEGYGNAQPKNGVQRFDALSQLTFGQGVVLTKTACNEDAMGCLIDLGFRWSTIRDTCVVPAQSGTPLRALALAEPAQPAAFLLFSSDQQQAEVFLPGQPNALALERTGEEGAHAWVQGDYRLFPWKGYVLQYQGAAVYAGG